MVNNSVNINKMNNHLSYEAIEYKKNTMTGLHKLCACLIYTRPSDNRDRRGHDHMVVGFITTYICNKCLSPLTL